MKKLKLRKINVEGKIFTCYLLLKDVSPMKQTLKKSFHQPFCCLKLSFHCTLKMSVWHLNWSETHCEQEQPIDITWRSLERDVSCKRTSSVVAACENRLSHSQTKQ